MRLLSLALLGALTTLLEAHALDGSRHSVDREPTDFALDVTSGPQCVAVPRPLPGMGIGFALRTASDCDKEDLCAEQNSATILEETYRMVILEETYRMVEDDRANFHD